MKFCLDCGEDISHRYWSAKRCEECADKKIKADSKKRTSIPPCVYAVYFPHCQVLKVGYSSTKNFPVTAKKNLPYDTRDYYVLWQKEPGSYIIEAWMLIACNIRFVKIAEGGTKIPEYFNTGGFQPDWIKDFLDYHYQDFWDKYSAITGNDWITRLESVVIPPINTS